MKSNFNYCRVSNSIKAAVETFVFELPLKIVAFEKEMPLTSRDS